jgi:hypothetical protein
VDGKKKAPDSASAGPSASTTEFRHPTENSLPNLATLSASDHPGERLQLNRSPDPAAANAAKVEDVRPLRVQLGDRPAAVATSTEMSYPAETAWLSRFCGVCTATLYRRLRSGHYDRTECTRPPRQCADCPERKEWRANNTKEAR